MGDFSREELIYLVNDEYDWYPFDRWPAWVQQQFFHHKTNNTRWRMFAFFVNNGLHPDKAIELITFDVNVTHHPYDRAALTDLRHMADCVMGRKGPLRQQEYHRKLHRVSYYDLALQVVRRSPVTIFGHGTSAD